MRLEVGDCRCRFRYRSRGRRRGQKRLCRQPSLGRPPAIDRRLGRTGPCCHAFDREFGHAALLQQLIGGLQDRPSCLFAPFATRPARLGRRHHLLLRPARWAIPISYVAYSYFASLGAAVSAYLPDIETERIVSIWETGHEEDSQEGLAGHCRRGPRRRGGRIWGLLPTDRPVSRSDRRRL